MTLSSSLHLSYSNRPLQYCSASKHYSITVLKVRRYIFRIQALPFPSFLQLLPSSSSSPSSSIMMVSRWQFLITCCPCHHSSSSPPSAKMILQLHIQSNVFIALIAVTGIFHIDSDTSLLMKGPARENARPPITFAQKRSNMPTLKPFLSLSGARLVEVLPTKSLPKRLVIRQRG